MYEVNSPSLSQVDGKSIADGDTVNVFVDVDRDPREGAVVPPSVRTSVEARQRARANRDFQTADRLQREIQDAGYRVFDQEGILAKKYRIRAR
jgi:cysteinyl-tRNA synthetase